LFLVLAPQQIERGREVGQVLDQRGIPFVYRREMTAATQRASRSVVCLLLNTPGEIKAFLAEATIVVLGRTFAGAGGQNPTDAAALGKPVVFGPDMGDFAEVSSQLVQAGAAVQVRDGAGLEAAVGQLLEDPTRREVLSRNARRTALAGTGALDQAAEMVVRGLARVEGMYTRSDASEMDIKASS
jgi:3-deoxy-D-manno-octulosonic-acid transferase